MSEFWSFRFDLSYCKGFGKWCDGVESFIVILGLVFVSRSDAFC